MQHLTDHTIMHHSASDNVVVPHYGWYELLWSGGRNGEIVGRETEEMGGGGGGAARGVGMRVRRVGTERWVGESGGREVEGEVGRGWGEEGDVDRRKDGVGKEKREEG